MSVTPVELTLRKELIKLTAERDRFAMACVDLRQKVIEHERVHTLCSAALADLEAKNAALEALVPQLMAGLQELADGEVSWDEVHERAIAACETAGLPGAP